MPNLPTPKKFLAGSGVRIYRIACQAFADLSARVYLLLGAGPPTLVDTGSGQPECTRHILAGLEYVRSEFGEDIGVGDIGRILITHGHVDHVGGLSELRSTMPAAVGAHELERLAVAAWDEHAVLAGRRLLDFFRSAGVPEEEARGLVAASRFTRGRCRSVPVDFTLADGQDLDGLRIIHTPGHAPGHVCLAVGNVLLCADHILARTIPQQRPEALAPYTGLGHYLDSLQKIERLGGFEIALGAHEQAIDDLPQRIAAIRASHLRRLERLLDVVRAARRPISICSMTHRMYGDAHGFRGMLALTDVGARVEYLHQRGRLAVANLGEVERLPLPVFRYVTAE